MTHVIFVKMSETINVESENLCTTEDAFEQFQAVSMYEEDEYITLSDIVSPPPPTQDIIKDMPSEDVTSLLVLGDNINEITSTTDQNIQQSGPKKRGRKKRKGLNGSNAKSGQHRIDECTPMSVNENDINHELSLEPDLNTVSQKLEDKPPNKPPRNTRPYVRRGLKKKPKQPTIRKGRPGRPRKIPQTTSLLIDDSNIDVTSSVNNVSNINEPFLETPPKKTTKRRRKQNVSSEMIDIKPKAFSNELLVEAKNDLASPVEKISLTDKIVVRQHKKHRKHKKRNIKHSPIFAGKINEISDNQLLHPNDLTEDDNEDMPLVALSSKRGKLENPDTSEHQLCTESINESTKTDINSTILKTPRKRGRPRNSDKSRLTNKSKEDENIKTTDISIVEKEIVDAGLNSLNDVTSSKSFNSDSQNTENKEGNDNINNQETQESVTDSMNKRNSKKPIMSDFEYNIDSIVKNDIQDTVTQQVCDSDSLSETRDSSKRPIRRKAKKNLHYDEGSDEDPYANVELSDEEPRRKKGGKYYSDDEYIPGSKRRISDFSDSDDIDDIDEEVEDGDDLLGVAKKQRRRRRKQSDSGSINTSPRKKGKKGDSDKSNNLDVFTKRPTSRNGDDLEDLLETSVIKTSDDAPKPWGTTKEFKEFLAKISQGTDIKIKKAKSIDNMKTQIQIPVLDPAEAKKTAEMGSQTNTIKTKPVAIQTNTVHEVPMKNQVTLTADQSEKACEFLSGIVRTTAELGQLMTQKSEDFIEKKINTTYVTDTFKMDYCVKKSFLLFRLAKHNLVQMEEDLAKQYEEFLIEHNLSQHREEQKIIESTSKGPNSDSDCEIVEEPVVKKEEVKVPFNPKTVILNKELSIKIAKKAQEETNPKEKLNIKGRHTVWINDSVMVKKVKPNQSFLAQDSRNKKPPDAYITLKMVRDFFKAYNRQKAVSICSAYVGPEWLNIKKIHTCCYFFDKTSESPESSTINNNGELVGEVTEHNLQNMNNLKPLVEHETFYPDSLISLCTKAIQKQMYIIDSTCNLIGGIHPNFTSLTSVNICKDKSQDATQLSELNKKHINGHIENQHFVKIDCLKTLSYKKIIELIHKIDVDILNVSETYVNKNYNVHKFNECTTEVISGPTPVVEEIKSLFLLCFEIVQNILIENSTKPRVAHTHVMCQTNSLKATVFNELLNQKVACKHVIYEPSSLKSIAFDELINQTNAHSYKIYEPNSLKSIVFDKLINQKHAHTYEIYEPNSLKSIVFNKLVNQKNAHSYEIYEPNSLKSIGFNKLINQKVAHTNVANEPNTLKSIVFNKLKNIYCNSNDELNNHYSVEEHISIDFTPTIVKKKILANPVSLKSLCFIAVKEFYTRFYAHNEKVNKDSHVCEDTLNFTINNVNTVSEDVFLNTTDQDYNEHNGIIEPTYLENEEHNYSDDCSYDNNLDNDDNNWVAQVEMKELRSFLESSNNNEHSEETSQNLQSDCIVNIKLEPLEDLSENILTSVKTEPLDEEETPLIPLVAVTKQESADATSASKEPQPILRQNSNSYDENTFEAFVSRNKMILSMDEHENIDEVFSQSTSRIRRQYEPDSDDDIDNSADNLNLLVPQNVEIAKDRLMESSSDEGTSKKKKPEKRRGRPKKVTKPNDTPPVKENLPSKSEIAILTRKMREKIRQVEKQNKSSDSELDDDTALSVRKDKQKHKDKSQKRQLGDKKAPEKEIQCSLVDSTEQINEVESKQNESVAGNVPENVQENVPENDLNILNEKNKETLFDMEKDKNLLNNEVSELNDNDDRSNSPLINADEPVELLECEPVIPMLEEFTERKQRKSKCKPKSATKCVTTDELDTYASSPFIVRHGWNCYPIDTKDGKIYKYAHIPLVKLPESFVETYLRYQDLSELTKDDTEVDKLTNLQTLHRTHPKEKGPLKIKEIKNSSTEPLQSKPSKEDKLLGTEIKIEPCDELLPSEDEDINVEDFHSPPDIPQQSAENCLARDLLMNDDEDNDSEKPDGDQKSKNEEEPDATVSFTPSPKKSDRTKKSKGDVENKETKKSNDNLMLTADKMMNKELALLHAPVGLKEEIPDTVETVPKAPSRSANKAVTKIHIVRDRSKDDDSSSEEEKQWFTTKEKLLKRLEKKQDCPNIDDAKRAKIVSEYIEKRNDGPKLRPRGKQQRRRSLKKLLERRKQMKILTRELLGDDSGHTGKKSSQTYGKGRRNIRKVINKKSLAHSTVKANMEEFERKQRLSMWQAQLREVLGCEEGVNVVVINDELCLEYDFEEMRPVVSVHPYFTKVMKAHQYEGVKFMWDACFESVAQVQQGHAGGGCILAHCMGLGKTLQVLALLHTVLTHPQVNMRRILVCCPLSTVLNWVDEIHKWMGPVTSKIKVFELSKLKKTYERAYQLEDWYNGGGIFIIGYELFRSLSTLDPVLDCVRPTIVSKIRTALLDPGPDMIICDEGHLLKNDCSVLAVAMSRVKTKRRIMLTGTPMQNNLREYYCMVDFVKPNLLGSYSEYSNRFENPIMNGQHRDSREEDIKLMKARTHILHKVLEGCLQRLEASVLYPYLPTKYEYTVFVSLTKSQRELYTHYLKNYAKETKQSVLKDFHVLQKIWTHPQVLHNFFTRTREEEKQQKIKVEKEDDLVQEDLGASEDIKPNATETWWLPYVAESNVLDELNSSNKFLVVFRLLEECIALGDKVLIFSTSLYTMDALEYFLRHINNWSLGREYYRLDGSVPAEVRQKWCREFNAESNTGTKLFLISTRAGSLGLNMTAANRVIILDTSWNPAHDIQSIFRVYRFGQKKDCFIYRLVAMGTMEQKIYERSVTKQAVACRVVDEQQIDRHYNLSELTELYRLDSDGSGVSAGLAAGVRDAALLRVASVEAGGAPLLHAVHEHDSLLRGSGETGLAEDERAAVWSQFQEEHANKHIQNIAMNLPIKQKNENSITPDTPNACQNTNDPSVLNAPETKIKSKRGRKPLANKNTPAQPSTSAQSESHLDPVIEEMMIKKIMKILIQHNFHTMNGPKEIAELVSKVRKTIANPKRGSLRNVDPVTASIARVLIEEGSSSSPIPALSDIKPIVPTETHIEPNESTETIVGTPVDYNSVYSVNQNESKDLSETEFTGRRRRRQRNEADLKPNQEEAHIGETESTETIVGTPVDYNNIYHTEPAPTEKPVEELDQYTERKRKRQRRNSDEEYLPEKHLNKNKATAAPKPKTRKSNENNVVLDSTNTSEIIITEPAVSIIPEINEQKTTTKRRGRKSKSNKNEIIIEDDKGKQQNEVEKNTDKEKSYVEKEKENEPESILLSDDEPVEIVIDQSIQSDNSKEKVTDTEAVNIKETEEPPIPLHKSLLTNKNFIKIVAHTYLSGNPMLDEDAAILAAQYSTLKALKELESTGNDIVNGPIYDIAVQVLGKELLKKLHIAGANKKDDTSNKLHKETNIKTCEKNKPSEDNVVVLTQNSSEPKKRAGPKRKTMTLKMKEGKPLPSDTITEIEDDVQPTTSAATLTVPEVVPVEMFLGPPTLRGSYRPPSQEECILPDDDDIVIGHQSPPLPPSSQHLPTSSHNLPIYPHSLPTSSHDIPTPMQTYVKRNSQPLILKSVSSDNRKPTVPKVVQIVKKQPIASPIPLPAPPFASKVSGQSIKLNTSSLADNANPVPVALTVLNTAFQNQHVIPTSGPILSNDTICLDSDDEDAPPAPVKAPILKALKSTTKLPNSEPSNRNQKIGQSLMPVKSQSRLTTILENKHKIILVPASEFGSLEASKNITMPSYHQRQSAHKAISEVVDMPQSMDSTPTVTTEQNVSKTIPGSRIQQTRSQRGDDIIRIYKSGKIDILRKVDKPVPVASTSKSPAKVVDDELITGDLEENITTEKYSTYANANTKMKSIIADKIQKTSETSSRSVVKVSTENEHQTQSYTSDNASNSDSPDPLSVLKNVVHIAADKYQTQKHKKGSNRVEVDSHPSTSIYNDTKISELLKSSNGSAGKTTEYVLKSFEASKSRSKDKNAKVIDLTDCFSIKKEEPKKKGIAKSVKNDSFGIKNEADKSKKKDTVKNINIKMSGTSKDIMISKGGALIHKGKNNTTETVEVVTKAHSNSLLNKKKSAPSTSRKLSSAEVNKRPSPWQDATNIKKKKTDSTTGYKPPMSLKDFNIDDFDDIIELE